MQQVRWWMVPYVVLSTCFACTSHSEVTTAAPLAISFRVHNCAGLVNADSPPSGQMRVDGAADGGTITIANPATGIYTASMTTPTGMTAGQCFEVWTTYTVSGLVRCACQLRAMVKDNAATNAGIIAAAVQDILIPVFPDVPLEGSFGERISFIFEKTNSLPGSPAATGAAMSLTEDERQTLNTVIHLDAPTTGTAAAGSFDKSIYNMGVVLEGAPDALADRFFTDGNMLSVDSEGHVTCNVTGDGTDMQTFHITNHGLNVEGARVRIATDAAGANIIGEDTTDAFGMAYFLLDYGTTYYSLVTFTGHRSQGWTAFVAAP